MIITHKLRPVDLTKQGSTQRVDAVQNDQYSRCIEFPLTANGEAWTIPDGATAIVRYKKPDGTGGNYDTMPDGSPAYSIHDNTLTVILAPQVLTVPGLVMLAVGLFEGDAEVNTFTVYVYVQSNPGVHVQSENYYKIAGMMPDSGWTPNAIIGTDADGNVMAQATDTTLSKSGQAADAAAVGTKLASLSSDMEDRISRTAGTQLYQKENDTDKFYYDNTGAIVYGYGWHITEDIPVSAGETLEYYGLTKTGNATYSVFKDTSGAVVHVFKQQTGENTIVVPDGATYVAFSLVTDDAETFRLISGRNYVNQLEHQEAKRAISAIDATVNIVPVWIDGKYILYTSGTEQESTAYSVTDFINVSGCDTVSILAKMAGYAGVCLYDSSQNYITGNVLPYEETAIDVSNVSYIRVSCQTAYVAEAKIRSDLYGAIATKAKYDRAIGNCELHTISIDTNAFSRGYLLSGGLTVVDSDLYIHSAFVPILGGQRIKLRNITPTNGCSVHFYDGTFTPVGHAENNKTGYLLTGEIVDTPLNAVYMRFMVRTDYATPEDVSALYLGDIHTSYLADAVTERWYSATNQRITHPLYRAASKLICTIIDDDTIDTASVLRFKAALDANGIKGTLATLTIGYERDANLKPTLLQMERQGHHVVLHGYSQIAEYQRPDENGNIEKCEEDFVHGLQDMLAAGFCNPKFWVSPYGSSQDSIQRIARRWGMQAMCASHNTYNTMDGRSGRYNLCRCALNERDSDPNDPNETYTSSMAEIKAIAEEAAENHGWLILMTHFSNWTDGEHSRFDEFVTYAKGLGFEFMTLGEAWDYRKPIYDLSDTL